CPSVGGLVVHSHRLSVPATQSDLAEAEGENASCAQLAQVEGLAARQPVLMVFEDIHSRLPGFGPMLVYHQNEDHSPISLMGCPTSSRCNLTSAIMSKGRDLAPMSGKPTLLLS